MAVGGGGGGGDGARPRGRPQRAAPRGPWGGGGGRAGRGAGGRPGRAGPEGSVAVRGNRQAGGCGTGACAGSVRLGGRPPNPLFGDATYGNAPENGLSFWSTPSPTGICLPPCSGLSRAPAITRSSMSVTSSASRRPFGNPATSPASTPKRLGLAVGGTPRLTFSVSAGAGLWPIWVSPGTPVSSAWTMSVRLVSLTPSLNRALSRRAGSGFSA